MAKNAEHRTFLLVLLFCFFLFLSFFRLCHDFSVTVLTLQFGGNSNIMWRILYMISFSPTFFSLSPPTFWFIANCECECGVNLKFLFKINWMFLRLYCFQCDKIFWRGIDWISIDSVSMAKSGKYHRIDNWHSAFTQTHSNTHNINIIKDLSSQIVLIFMVSLPQFMHIIYKCYVLILSLSFSLCFCFANFLCEAIWLVLALEIKICKYFKITIHHRCRRHLNYHYQIQCVFSNHHRPFLINSVWFYSPYLSHSSSHSLGSCVSNFFSLINNSLSSLESESLLSPQKYESIL